MMNSSIQMKKIQGKKSRKNSFRSNSELSSTNEKSVSYKDLSNCKENFRTNSNHSSSLFSSNPTSRSTSISSNSFPSSFNYSHSRSLSEIKRSSSFDYKILNINKQKGFNESYAGICIFLVSLFSLVICGKVLAILTCTSSCLFFAPAPRRCRRKQSLRKGCWREIEGATAMNFWSNKEVNILHACLSIFCN